MEETVRHLDPGETLERRWLTKKQTMEYTGLRSIREVNRRIKKGDPNFLVSQLFYIDGRPGRRIDARSMPPEAQDRWRQDLFRNADKPEAEPAQRSLFPSTEIDRQLDAIKLRRSERGVVARRFRDAVEPCLNHNWKAEGYPSLGAFQTALAKRLHTTKRTIQTWVCTYKQRENLLDLVDERPGPVPGTRTILDADMRAHLKDCWVFQKLSRRQCYRSLVSYLTDKQNSRGCRVDHFYRIPGRSTVENYITKLSPLDHAEREGADALKTACGYTDRTYRDARSLDRVDVDEWIVDALAYDPRHASRVGRYYLLTFLDERSIYPLVWSLVEQPNEEDEIDLLCRLIRDFGAPGLINSDRGRFRGRTFGGRFLNRNRADMYEERDGILDRLQIGRNKPGDEHNPQGNRLERFHLELANWARTVPGWCGRDTKERRMTDADARVVLHKKWILTGQGELPLLSRDQLLERLNQFMAEFRQRTSDGNDMDGFAPEAVFRQNTPAAGFRRISDEELAWHTAEHFSVLVRPGGIIQLRDGKRYSHPQLLLIQGEHREAARLRHNHDQLSVLPAAKGEEAIIAKRRTRVGTNDPDQLAAAMELQKRQRKLVGEMVKPLDYDPGAQFLPEAPKATQVIHPSEFFAAQPSPEPDPPKPERPEPKPLDFPEISSVEWHMQGKHRRPQGMDFADLES